MAFAVTHDFTAGTSAQASQINTNFGDIETELDAFPTNGALKDGAISTTAKLADNIVTWAKLAAASAKDEDDMTSNSATAVASQQSIKAYVDNNIGSANWTPTSYAGQQSITYPNGTILKMGSVSVAPRGTETVAYSAIFPTTCTHAQATFNSTLNNIGGPPVVSPYSGYEQSKLQVTNCDGTRTLTIYWQAWGY